MMWTRHLGQRVSSLVAIVNSLWTGQTMPYVVTCAAYGAISHAKTYPWLSTEAWEMSHGNATAATPPTFHSYEVSDIVRQHSVHSTHDARSRTTSDTSLPSPSSFRPLQHSTPEATGNSLSSAAPNPPSPTWPQALALQPAANTTLPAFHPRIITAGFSLSTLILV